jgi:penicillin-binding protein 1C
MKILFSIIIFLIITSPAYALPSFQEVKDSYRKSDAVLLDRHGKIIHELRVDPKFRRLDWTSIEEISPAFIKTVVLSEDKRFYEHQGVDWLAVSSAVIKNLFTKKSRGASTITMQLASMLDESLKPKGSKRTTGQKWDQMKAAKKLEETWSKKEILEAYQNLLTFRGELQGVSAASRGLFDKEPSGLNESESLILASLIRAPNASIEKVGSRACGLGSSLNPSIKCEDIKMLAERTLTNKYSIKQSRAFAPHVAYQMLKGKDNLNGTEITTTLDRDLQCYAIDVLKHHILSVRHQNVNDGAVLIVENKTGDVLAYVGSIGYESSARYVDGITAKRQAGSTLKPFLYALALEKEVLTPASILSDSPIDISTGLGVYKPENYENDFKGMVSVRTALASSLNIPAVRTLSLTGIDPFIQKLKLLGFGQLKSDDYYGFSVALGSADISLWELVNAYRTLANNGFMNDLRLRFEDKDAKSTRVFSEEVVFIISDILSDREARSYTFSLENPLSTKYWSAVKTGTSKDMRDNWCIGYSDKYTVGVWVGNFSGAAMWNVSGITGAAPVWLEIMNYLHRENPVMPPEPPSGVFAKRVGFQNNMEPARVEWFIQNTGPANTVSDETIITLNTAHDFPHILYPSDGTTIALDPDIPVENQYIFFEAETSHNDLDWVLNGQSISETFQPVLPWQLKQGKYLLSLADKQNRVIDSVVFQVKGAAHSPE